MQDWSLNMGASTLLINDICNKQPSSSTLLPVQSSPLSNHRPYAIIIIIINNTPYSPSATSNRYNHLQFYTSMVCCSYSTLSHQFWTPLNPLKPSVEIETVVGNLLNFCWFFFQSWVSKFGCQTCQGKLLCMISLHSTILQDFYTQGPGFPFSKPKALMKVKVDLVIEGQ